MRSSLVSVALFSAVPLSFAAPATTISTDASLNQERGLGGLLGGVLGVVDGVATGLLNDINAAISAGDSLGLADMLSKISPKSHPESIKDVVAKQSAILGDAPNFFVGIATQLTNGLFVEETLKTVLTGGFPVGENSHDNANPSPPSSASVYPQKLASDAPYSIPEATLRAAIYIPSTFTYGAKRPVLFVPGTGSYGGAVFAGNLRKLLTNVPYADPVWLNVPGAMLNDTQSNAEYIAYAVNYISAISQSRKDVAAITWSQGGLDMQWALKYWPSVRDTVTDFLPYSADFRGTILGNVLCLTPDSQPGLNPCAPAGFQQQVTSQYVAALQADGGESAYVPTTSFYSGFFDEVVQPQSGTGASAYMSDARNVGILNVEVQTVCKGQLGAALYDHAGVLFHPLAYALVVDALTNEGPGRLDRIDVRKACGAYAAPGLTLDDVLATTGMIPIAGLSLLLSPERTTTEPELRAYAR